MEHFVYILFSHKLDKFYIGASENVDLRLFYHNNPIENRKFTAKGIPWELKLSIPCKDKSKALKLEKKLNRLKADCLLWT